MRKRSSARREKVHGLQRGSKKTGIVLYHKDRGYLRIAGERKNVKSRSQAKEDAETGFRVFVVKPGALFFRIEGGMQGEKPAGTL
jgi:hypothetical protein